jgi:hypothetical protein
MTKLFGSKIPEARREPSPARIFARRAESRRSTTQKSLRPGADFLEFCLHSIATQFGSTFPDFF